MLRQGLVMTRSKAQLVGAANISIGKAWRIKRRPACEVAAELRLAADVIELEVGGNGVRVAAGLRRAADLLEAEERRCC